MSAQQVQEIIERVKALPLEDQIEVSKAIDRFTWAQRFRQICERIEARVEASGETISDEEIDEIVRQVRRERRLSKQSSTIPS